MKSKITGILSIVAVLALVLTGTAYAADTLVVDNTSPAVGNVISFSGVCGTTAGGQVEIAVVTGASRAVIGRMTTDTGGVFANTLTLPNNLPLGAATLESRCPSASVVTASINLVADPPDLSVPSGLPNSAASGGSVSSGVSTAPAGGVAAGAESSPNVLAWVMILTILGAGMYSFSRIPRLSDQ